MTGGPRMIPESIFPMLVNQLIQISCVALAAVLVTRVLAGHRPHLVHAAWLLVLLKCVTPPVFSSPISPFSWAQTVWESAEAPDESQFVHSTERGAEHEPGRQDYRVSASPLVRAQLDSSPPGKSDAGRSGFERGDRRQASAWSAFSLSRTQLLLHGWLVISAGIFTLIIARLVRFLRLVEQTKIQEHSCGTYLQRVNCLVSRVEARLGMRHRARISVLDALVGPAILGVVRPTILLPKIVVDRFSDKQLETLIAHELVHFRRGDLWWSALQAMAVGLYWCNPLVWFARAVINREAEKCCDEETIGSLKCDPGEYARCLIRVLECKNSLRVAPLLPGVRPVDITTKRLERIMRLRHGCHSHCPQWVMATLVLGAMVMLPGASLSFAQQDPTSDTQPVTEKPLAATQDAVLPLEPAFTTIPDTRPLKIGNDERVFYFMNEAVLQQAGYRVEALDVTDVLQQFAKSENGTPDSAASQLVSRLPKGEHWESETKTTPADVIAGVVFQDSRQVLRLGGEHPSVRVAGNTLYVLGTEQHLDSLRSYLRHFRCLGPGFLVYEVRILDIPTSSLDALEIDWKGDAGRFPMVNAEETKVVAASFNATDPQSIARVAQIDPSHIADMLNSERCTVVCAPKITTLNEQSAEILVGSPRPFVVGYTPVEESDGNPAEAYQPKVRTIDEGINLELMSRVNTIDPSSLQLEFRLSKTEIETVDTFTFEKNGREFEVQVPTVNTASLESTIDVKLNSSIAITGTPELVQVVAEHKVPILGNIPYINRLFKNKSIASELRSTVVLVSCKLAQTRDESSSETPQRTRSDFEQASTGSKDLQPEPLPATPVRDPQY